MLKNSRIKSLKSMKSMKSVFGPGKSVFGSVASSSYIIILSVVFIAAVILIANKQQIQEIYEEMNNEENDIEEKINAKFVVTKLYHKGSKKMATLRNKEYIGIE
jgi:predicted PurR-regulated permease PerM